MRLIENVETPFLVFQEWEKFGEIIHFVTTRHGGTSEGPYASLNIGFGTGDNYETVIKNRERIACSIGIPLSSFIMLNQVHGNSIVIATSVMKGSGAFTRETAIKETDAVITNEPGICLFVMAADCVPLLFFDPAKKVIAAAHAGWRGTLKQIALETVKKMCDVFDCSSSDIIAAIGPSIGPCCYNVGGEVIDSVLRSFGTTDRFITFRNDNSSANFDLWFTNKFQLLHAGLKEENITIANICTCCNHNDFYSSRFDKGITGRFGAGIMIK